MKDVAERACHIVEQLVAESGYSLNDEQARLLRTHAFMDPVSLEANDGLPKCADLGIVPYHGTGSFNSDDGVRFEEICELAYSGFARRALRGDLLCEEHRIERIHALASRKYAGGSPEFQKFLRTYLSLQEVRDDSADECRSLAAAEILVRLECAVGAIFFPLGAVVSSSIQEEYFKAAGVEIDIQEFYPSRTINRTTVIKLFAVNAVAPIVFLVGSSWWVRTPAIFMGLLLFYCTVVFYRYIGFLVVQIVLPIWVFLSIPWLPRWLSYVLGGWIVLTFCSIAQTLRNQRARRNGFTNQRGSVHEG